MNQSSKAPILHMIGNAHLDPAWMWMWGEGMEAFIATCRAALDRMEETPDFTFTCGSAAHYQWIEEVEPELFEAIRQRSAEGRWEIVGGWWLQADCNLPSGEGFVRQALLGQRYYMEKFGRRAHTGYSPDAFGHDRGLPQLLVRAGMDNYIFCRPDPNELALPSPLFIWRSPDGSQVLGYRVPFHYNMYESSVPKKVADMMQAYNRPSPLADDQPLNAFSRHWAIFYGVGNHGGGPTKEHIRQIIEFSNTQSPSLPPSPSGRGAGGEGVRFGTLDGFFREVRGEDRALPMWDDDLQLNAPGCYSAHSQIKKLNRQSEHLLMAAERFSALASLLCGGEYPADELRRAWRNVCFNHFHDILCGVAIREALDDAIEMYGEALNIAKRSTRYALQRIARAINTTGDRQTLIVFNSHSWSVSHHVTFELWHDIDKSLWPQPVYLRVVDDEGNEVAHQMEFTSGKIGRDRIAGTFRAEVPPLGWRCYRVFYGEKSSVADVPADGRNSATALENGLVRVEFSSTSGAISRFHHKGSGREMLSGEAALPIAIEDRTDTWGHGVTKFDNVIGTFGAAELRLVENGPTHATVRSVSRWRNCYVQQDFRLYHDSDNLHVSVKVFWDEQYVMLKLLFAANVDQPRATYEAAYCTVEKPCDGTERTGGAWAAIIGTKNGSICGLGIPNDAKHGYSADGLTLAMTVLRSPSYATHDPHPYHPDEDLDFLDQGVQRFGYTLVPIVREGDPTGRPYIAELHREAALLNAPLLTHFESGHKGRGLERSYGGIKVTPDNVAATVVKQSEDGSGWVVRLYETVGKETEARVRMPVLECDWSGRLGAHEVKTLRVEMNKIAEVDLTEMQVG
jgi:alpha-mannosidase